MFVCLFGLPARVVRLFKCSTGPQTARSPASCPVQLQSNPPAGLHGEDLGLSALLKGTSAVVPPPWSNLSTRLTISSNLKSKVYSYRPSRLVFVEMYDCKQRGVKKKQSLACSSSWRIRWDTPDRLFLHRRNQSGPSWFKMKIVSLWDECENFTCLQEKIQNPQTEGKRCSDRASAEFTSRRIRSVCDWIYEFRHGLGRYEDVAHEGIFTEANVFVGKFKNSKGNLLNPITSCWFLLSSHLCSTLWNQYFHLTGSNKMIKIFKCVSD